ncbi:hypothetical protein MNBD_ALPHA06-1060, partial [hydrothermal vent metagenome]
MRVDKVCSMVETSNMSNNSHNSIVNTTIHLDGHCLIVEHPKTLASRSGPVWMFIHGIAVCPGFWQPLMPADFCDNVAWVSVSLPVHAPSLGPKGFLPEQVMPDLFNRLNGAVLEQLLPGRDVVIVGHSTGGFAGLCLALARPDQVRGVACVGGFADGRWIGLEGDMQLMARKQKLGFLGPMALRGSSWLTTRWPWLHAKAASMFAYDKRAFLADIPTKAALQAMRRAARSQNQNQLIAFFAGIRDVDIWQQVAQIEQPVLVMTGAYDPVIPQQKTLRLAKTLPAGQLLLYPD